MTAKLPRVVLVLRETEYELLLSRHATHAQAAFFLQTRGQAIDEVQQRHAAFARALQLATTSIPGRWRRTRVLRRDLARFIFEPEDIVVIVGQDGLVANTAKYLTGQPVVGINPDPARYEGVLVPHPPQLLRDLLPAVAAGRAASAQRTMVEAELDDGQRLLALNEIFVGVRTHQSARYRLRHRGLEERQSSSGLIVSTGTGATGWARSIARGRGARLPLPAPEEQRLVFFVREAWPSVATGTSLTAGKLGRGNQLEVVSENDEGGVIFGDGIEEDFLVFDWGQQVRLRLAQARLNLVAA